MIIRTCMSIFKRGKHRAPSDRKTLELIRLRDEIISYELIVSRLSDDRDRLYRVNVSLRHQISSLTEELGEARAPSVNRRPGASPVSDTRRIPVLIPDPSLTGSSYRPNWALNEDGP